MGVVGRVYASGKVEGGNEKQWPGAPSFQGGCVPPFPFRADTEARFVCLRLLACAAAGVLRGRGEGEGARVPAGRGRCCVQPAFAVRAARVFGRRPRAGGGGCGAAVA